MQVSPTRTEAGPRGDVDPGDFDVAVEALIEEARQRRNRRRRRHGAIFAATVCAGLGVYLAVAQLAGEEANVTAGPHSVAIAAAPQPDRILHIESRWVVWGGGRSTLEQGWSLPDSTLMHVVYRDGKGSSDCVIGSTRMRCWNAGRRTIDVYRFERPTQRPSQSNYVAYTSSWPASLERALRTGYARRIGRTTFAGRPADAVLLAVPGRPGPPRYEKGVSNTLYLVPGSQRPIAEKMPAGRWTRYFDTFELLADTRANRVHLGLGAPPDARVVVHPVGEYPPETK